jgi:hypothetical protein
MALYKLSLMSCVAGFKLSKEERKPVHVNDFGDVANLSPVESYLISKHDRSWHFNGVWPVIITETEGIGKVKDGFL